jgi:hypothetical protein
LISDSTPTTLEIRRSLAESTAHSSSVVFRPVPSAQHQGAAQAPAHGAEYAVDCRPLRAAIKHSQPALRPSVRLPWPGPPQGRLDEAAGHRVIAVAVSHRHQLLA